MESTFSFDALKTANSTHYKEMEAYGGQIALGAVNSEDMIEWIESNDDPATRRFAGLRLLVKSVVEVVSRNDKGEITEAKRIPKDQRDEFLVLFQQKDARENGRVVSACLELNGLDRASKKMEALKNDSGEVRPVASPIDSPSPQGV